MADVTFPLRNMVKSGARRHFGLPLRLPQPFKRGECRAAGDAMASDSGREIALERRKERLEAALRANLKQRRARRRARLAAAQSEAEPRQPDGVRADHKG